MAGNVVSERQPIRFQLKHVFYATAVVAASLALFGPIGFIAACGILGTWGAIGHRRLTLVETLVPIAITGMLLALIAPSQHADHQFRRMSHIGEALRAYHDQFGCLPPAFVPDERGRPMHSWRVLILPQLGCQSLFDSYHFDEPWDSLHNRKLREQMPSVYRLDSRASIDGATGVQAIVGPHTAWPGDRSRTLDLFKGAEYWPILAMYCDDRPVPWTAPRDLDTHEAARILAQPVARSGGYWHKGFFSSIFYGRTFIVPGGARLGRPTEAELIAASQPEPFDRHGTAADLAFEARPRTVIHWDNHVRLLAFIVVLLWPVWWLIKSEPDESRG